MTLTSPFNEMLADLSDVDGYAAFCDHIRQATKLSLSWKAEVKGLFEIHKSPHPLIRITAQQDGEPDGHFLNGNGAGIFEAAFIAYLFDANQDKQKSLNRMKAEIRRRQVGTTLRDEVLGLEVEKKPGGIIARGYNVDLVDKVRALVERKRKQHKDQPETSDKVWYIFVDSPPTALQKVASELQTRVQGMLKQNEIVVVSAIGAKEGVFYEFKLEIYARNTSVPKLDFANRYLETLTAP
jgi:hypothetical protein